MEIRLNLQKNLTDNSKTSNNQRTNNTAQLKRKDVTFGDSFSMIKPEAVYLEKLIFDNIKSANFNVDAVQKTLLPLEVIRSHYEELGYKAKQKLEAGNDFLMRIYNNVIEDMQQGPVVRFIVKGDESEVARYRTFVGSTKPAGRDPRSLRAFIALKQAERLKALGATDKEIAEYIDRRNGIHASDTDCFYRDPSIKNWAREIELHFPGYQA